MTASGSNSAVDVDAFLDLTEYDSVSNYQSPSMSPSKQCFASPVTAVTTPSNMATAPAQTLSGPSHNYDLYRQQTGFVPGAIANTMAVNQTNNTGYQDYGSLDYLPTFNSENDFFDFNTSPSQPTMGASDIDMDFESPADTAFMPTVNPSNIEQESAQMAAPVVPTQSGNVGRLWPGAHSQAAMAKAQQQQRHQQRLIQQQQHSQRQSVSQPKARGKTPHQNDPLVEQKITQLLNSMRAQPAMGDNESEPSSSSLARTRKEEEEMDEDERLLASEEGKKLSSKERRQLRNKVSARAFRSRRKEYISQLESEIATKVTENGELRSQNRALMEENKRLSDLTRMLLSSNSFSSFLDTLSTNPQQVKAEPEAQPQPQQEQRQIPKDTNPYNPQSQQQIGMAMIPEQNLDFSMLSLDNANAFNFQPQVFVVDTPDIPAPLDTALLSGKTSNFIEETCEIEEQKPEAPVVERPVEVQSAPETACTKVDEEFESDPEFALFHSEAPISTESAQESELDLFNGIESEKALSRYELVDASEEEASAALAMETVLRISSKIESVVSRLESATSDW